MRIAVFLTNDVPSLCASAMLNHKERILVTVTGKSWLTFIMSLR